MEDPEWPVERAILLELMADSDEWFMQGDAFARCGEDTFWAMCMDCSHGWEIEKTCKLRCCPACGDRRAKRLVARYADNLLAEAAVPRLKFMTLTVQNVEELRGSVFHRLREAWNTFRRAELGPWGLRTDPDTGALHRAPVSWAEYDALCAELGHAPTVDDCLDGGFYAFEANWRYVDGSWNVHLHALVQTRPSPFGAPAQGQDRGVFLPQAALSLAWHQATDGWGYVVDVRGVNDPDGARAVLADFAKYVSKAPQIGAPGADDRPEALVRAERRFEFLKATKDTRMIQTFGVWHGHVTAEDAPLCCPECGSANVMTELQLPAELQGPAAGAELDRPPPGLRRLASFHDPDAPAPSGPGGDAPQAPHQATLQDAAQQTAAQGPREELLPDGYFDDGRHPPAGPPSTTDDASGAALCWADLAARFDYDPWQELDQDRACLATWSSWAPATGDVVHRCGHDGSTGPHPASCRCPCGASHPTP